MKKKVRRSTSYSVFSVGITVLVIAILLMFILTFSNKELLNIGTKGIYTDVANASYVSQPWIWSLILAFLVLLLFFITKGGDPKSMESDSEEGTTHE